MRKVKKLQSLEFCIKTLKRFQSTAMKKFTLKRRTKLVEWLMGLCQHKFRF
jgi:hypothetical protein